MPEKNPLLDDKEIMYLITKAQEGDKDAQDKIVRNNMALVWSIVKRFYNRGFETDDLVQIGCIGLVKAIKKFDKSYNVKFSTYAVPMIMGEIKRFIRDDGIIKISRSLKETSVKVKYMQENLLKKLNREPTINEVAEALKLPLDDVLMSLDATNSVNYLYDYVNDDESKVVLDTIVHDEDERESIIDKLAIKEVLKRLTPEERKLIIMRYFKEKTQVEIAASLGLSQVQISRMEKRILLKMRSELKGE